MIHILPQLFEEDMSHSEYVAGVLDLIKSGWQLLDSSYMALGSTVHQFDTCLCMSVKAHK